MKRDSQSPDHYIASIEGEQKKLLLEIRKLIFEADPNADEIIEYGMLGYTDFVNLAAQKHYVSLYVSPRILAEYRKQHPDATFPKNCGKSCLRFGWGPGSISQFDPASIRALLKDIVDRRERGEDMGCC